MRNFILLASFFVMFVSCNVPQTLDHSWVEDNDLWQEDDLYGGKGITEEQFKNAIELGHLFYDPIAEQNNESLTINGNWTDSTVNANCSRNPFGGGVTINMYGGLARREEVNLEGFVLVLCHELGHAYGGLPYIQTWTRMSAEGQADYIGAKECQKKVIGKMLDTSFATPPYVQEKCDEVFGGNSEVCVRQMSGAQSLGNLLAVLKKVDPPSFETPDPTVVDKTELSYPKTIQCRLDTYHNGILNGKRPACWFKD